VGVEVVVLGSGLKWATTGAEAGTGAGAGGIGVKTGAGATGGGAGGGAAGVGAAGGEGTWATWVVPEGSFWE
jgi:hypothetical protein